jgi:hypothetical protein
MLENRLPKKSVLADGEDIAWVTASEKIEVILMVEASPLPVRRPLAHVIIAKSPFRATSTLSLISGVQADVAAADFNPLWHYLNSGIHERPKD